MVVFKGDIFRQQTLEYKKKKTVPVANKRENKLNNKLQYFEM